MRTTSAPSRVEIDLEPDLPLVRADLGLLDRVLANVVENALKHSGNEEVRVTAGRIGDTVQLRVVDRGPGVDDADKERIFAAFQRVGDTPQGDGLGLGLAVARGLMTVMGGSLVPEDTPGGGLTMVIELPLSSDLQPAQRRTRDQGARRRRRPPPAADADDRAPGARQRGRDRRRRPHGGSVGHARTPPTSSSSISACPTSTAPRCCAASARSSVVPVIVLSARHESDDKIEALDLGADDYVTKPFGVEELLARVRAAVRRGGDLGRHLAPVVTDHFTLDFAERRATVDAEEVRLTPTEWRVLETLCREPGHLVLQQDLLRAVWGPSYGRESNYLRVYANQLRRKLEPDPANPRHLAHRARPRLPLQPLTHSPRPSRGHVGPPSPPSRGHVWPPCHALIRATSGESPTAGRRPFVAPRRLGGDHSWPLDG